MRCFCLCQLSSNGLCTRLARKVDCRLRLDKETKIPNNNLFTDPVFCLLFVEIASVSKY